MCGVFGYVGINKVGLSDYLLEGLTNLEYRGYDSSGLAIISEGKLKVVKEVGEVKNLKKNLKNTKLSGTLGIGHTRWATHGGVTVKNAHPHLDCKKEIIVVHNGIIENYLEIKNKLIKKGHIFTSETDTEVFAHLVEDKLKGGKKLFIRAVRESFNEIEGLNAVVVSNLNNEMIAYKNGSPLVVGCLEGASLISSDIPTLTSLTEKIILIKDGEGVLLNSDGVWHISAKNEKLTKIKPQILKMEEIVEDKGKYPHFMLKEIHEEPNVISKISLSKSLVINKAVDMIRLAKGTYFTACGTAAYSGIAATYWFSDIANKHVNFSFGSEFPYFENFLVPQSLLIAASQSGETMDTLEAVRAAKRHHSKILSLVNVPGSTLGQMSDYATLLQAGPEKAVVSTKAYVAKLAHFLLFAYALKGKLKDGQKLLNSCAIKMKTLLSDEFENIIKRLAKKIINAEHLYVIGRGVNYATALEGALKIKEAAYLHSEAFPGGELKHGVIALIQKDTPCVVVVPNDKTRQSIISNAMELKSRGAYIIGISPNNEEVFNFWIKVPDAQEASPIVNIVPFQLLSYYLAILKGHNPDRPRNLAKSVTVK